LRAIKDPLLPGTVADIYRYRDPIGHGIHGKSQTCEKGSVIAGGFG